MPPNELLPSFEPTDIEKIATYFFQIFGAALNVYPVKNTRLEKVQAQQVVPPPVSGTTPGFNQGDVWKLHVKLTNTGPLGMKAVRLIVTPSNGVRLARTAGNVNTPPGSYVQTALTLTLFDVLPNGSATCPDWVWVQVPPNAPTGAPIELYRVTIDDWDADLSSMLVAAAKASASPHLVDTETVGTA